MEGEIELLRQFLEGIYPLEDATFRFLIAHERRHFQQIDRVLKVVVEKSVA